MVESSLKEGIVLKLKEQKHIEKGKYKNIVIAIPEMGLVGLLAARKLVEDLKMERVGYVVSDVTSVIIRYENGKPEPLVRLFGKDNLLVLLYEAPLDLPLILPFAKFVLNLIKEKEIELPIMLASAPSTARMEKSDSELFILGAPVGDDAEKILKDNNIKKLENGTLGGPFAYVLNNLYLDNKSGIVLLAETFHVPITDPGSAARLLEVLARILGLENEIRIDDLIEKAEELKLQMRKLQETTKSNLPKELGMLYT